MSSSGKVANGTIGHGGTLKEQRVGIPVYLMAGQSNAYTLNGGNGGVSLAQEYTSLTGSKNVDVASVQASGAPLTWGRSDGDWYHPSKLFQSLVQTITSALSTPGAYLASIVWIQGEGDTWSFARATEYAARLIDMVHRIETALSSLDEQIQDFRFTVLTLSTHCPAKEQKANWETIREQQLSIHDPRIDVVDVDNLNGVALPGSSFYQSDGLHYNSSANEMILAALLENTAIELDGTTGSDSLTGRSANDTLRGGGGEDNLNGGPGNDLVCGWSGNDTIIGGTGNDTINAGTGCDLLYGGLGNDVFTFYNASELGLGSACDTIADFASGQDKVKLNWIDADVSHSGNQSFQFIGSSGFSQTAGELQTFIDDRGTRIAVDVDGDGQADGSLFLSGVIKAVASDFIF